MKWLRCRSAASAAAIFALTCVILAPAADAQEDRLTVRLGYGVTWDDNVFRLPDDAADPEPGRGRSDRFSTASVGLHLNIPVSMQRFLLDATKSAVRYDKFSSRDQDPFTYRGAWLYQVTSRLSGEISASRSETLVNVEDVLGRRAIERKATTLSATADAWLWSGWHLVGNASGSETRHDPVFFSQPDTEQVAIGAGVRYVARSNSQVTVLQRTVRGKETVADSSLLPGNDFTQDDTELSATWVASGRSTLHLRLAHMKRENERLPTRDFTGNAGELRFAWQPSGRLDASISAARSIEPFNISLFSTTRVEDALSALLTYTWSEALSFQFNGSRRVSRYGQVGEFESRRDVTDAVGVGARWVPRRYVSFDARLRHERRDSTEPAQIFDANIGSLNVELRF